MGQNRTDTQNQLQAKRDGAEKRRCPNCNRKNAMSDMSLPDVHRARQCRYCQYAKGYFYADGLHFEENPNPQLLPKPD